MDYARSEPKIRSPLARLHRVTRFRVGLALLGALLAGVFFSAAAIDIHRKGEHYEVRHIKGFEHADTPLEVMFAWSGDGLAYAELARHPWIDSSSFTEG